MKLHPSPQHLTGFDPEKKLKKHISTELPKQNNPGGGKPQCAFPKRGLQHGSFEFHHLTFGNDAKLSALFSVRDKTCDLSELRCTL